ncbi:MAG TPA: acyltransferase family protein [Acidimicrobiales bacterium]
MAGVTTATTVTAEVEEQRHPDDVLPAGQGAGPGAGTWRHIPALDGLRGVAVAAVLLYHGGIGWAKGGYLGVDAFFVLSGFLITSLLLDETARTGTVALARFWSRRARRLLPAVLVLVAAVAGYAVFFAASGTLDGIRKDAIATLGYVANWRYIFAKASYFERTAPPSPLRHTWSLAIEEQFYVIWPLLVLAVARGSRSRLKIGVLAGTLAAGSVAAMVLLFHPGQDPSRVYYGTDTRANVILIGALLAVIVASRRDGARKDAAHEDAANEDAAPSGVPRSAVVPWLLGTAALGGAAGWLWAVVRVDGTASWLYRGGLPALALAIAAVIAHAVMVPAGVTAKVLSLAPLRALGRISYGVYLWHWPLFLTLTRARTGLGGWSLFALRIAVTLAVSMASYWAVELPVRRGLLPHWRSALALPAAVAGVCALVLATTASSMVPAAAILPAGTTGGTTPPGTVPVPAGPSHRPPRPPGQPARVLVVGDSVAQTLADGLTPYASQYGLSIDNKGTLGCGVVRGGPYRYFGQISQELPDCETWPDRWAQNVRREDPDVVMAILGRWEVMDRVHDGRWSRIGDLDFDVYLETEIEHAVSVLSAGGAKVAFVTAPYYLRGERPDGGRWPEDDPARVDEWNRLLREVVSRHPAQASIVDLNYKTGPDGKYVNYIDGVKLRYDGVHFTPQGDHWLAPWLLPQLAALGPPVVNGASPYTPLGTTPTIGSVTPTTRRRYVTSTSVYRSPSTTTATTRPVATTTHPPTTSPPTTAPYTSTTIRRR